MNIITISRQFGSGGRELGKRLADLLGYDYYDREIITAIAEKNGLDEKFVERSLENSIFQPMPITFGRSFAVPALFQVSQTNLLLEQKKVIDSIAEQGRNCIIVGRNADILLRDKKPFNIFVCAETEAKIKRCLDRAKDGETRKEIEKNMKQIDKNRAKTREIVMGGKWGNAASYHLTVNTTDWEIKELVPAVGDFAMRYFNRNK